jgi:hypothetical protein
VSAAGTRLRHSTLLGGAEDVTVEMEGEVGSGIAVDSTGGVYVVGDTDAASFPTTRQAFARNLTGLRDAFVTKLQLDRDDDDDDDVR